MTVREILKWLHPGEGGSIEILWDDDKLYPVAKDDDFFVGLVGDFLIDEVYSVNGGFQITLKTTTAKPLKAGDVA